MSLTLDGMPWAREAGSSATSHTLSFSPVGWG